MPPPLVPVGEEAHAKGGCVHLRIHRVHCRSALSSWHRAGSQVLDRPCSLQPCQVELFGDACQAIFQAIST